MLFLLRSAPEVEKRIHSKLFRKFWEEPGYKGAGLHYCTDENLSKEMKCFADSFYTWLIFFTQPAVVTNMRCEYKAMVIPKQHFLQRTGWSCWVTAVSILFHSIHSVPNEVICFPMVILWHAWISVQCDT